MSKAVLSQCPQQDEEGAKLDADHRPTAKVRGGPHGTRRVAGKRRARTRTGTAPERAGITERGARSTCGVGTRTGSGGSRRWFRQR